MDRDCISRSFFPSVHWVGEDREIPRLFTPVGNLQSLPDMTCVCLDRESKWEGGNRENMQMTSEGQLQSQRFNWKCRRGQHYIICSLEASYRLLLHQIHRWNSIVYIVLHLKRYHAYLLSWGFEININMKGQLAKTKISKQLIFIDFFICSDKNHYLTSRKVSHTVWTWCIMIHNEHNLKLYGVFLSSAGGLFIVVNVRNCSLKEMYDLDNMCDIWCNSHLNEFSE